MKKSRTCSVMAADPKKKKNKTKKEQKTKRQRHEGAVR